MLHQAALFKTVFGNGAPVQKLHEKWPLCVSKSRGLVKKGRVVGDKGIYLVSGSKGTHCPIGRHSRSFTPE